MLLLAILFTLIQPSVQFGFLLNTFNLPETDKPQQTTKVFQKPAFCHDLDCPEYEVLETNDVRELFISILTKHLQIKTMNTFILKNVMLFKSNNVTSFF